MLIQICVGSSCCIKGSYELTELFHKAVSDNGLESEITLAGSFCTGKCNREGVTVMVDGEVYTGLTPAGFNTFWDGKIMKNIKK